MVRSLAEQSTDELGGPGSVLARQRRDHARLDRLMDRYWSAAGDEGGTVMRDIVQLVFSHAFAEETVLWPAVRRLVPGGEELTAEIEAEHQRINELIARFERTDPDDPGRPRLVAEAFALIRQDIRDEEDRVLPRLQEVLDDAHLARLGAAWEAARLTAPTHPHPAVPRRPPGNVLAGVPLSAYDRTRDVLSPGRRSPVWSFVLAAAAAAAAGGAAAGALRGRAARRP
ncbi:hemerythrin domain-containing protein [Streptomyces albus]|uniref:hemerythrin domain-containing protein n=1 Tax=Streptomyces albus TaxID=1888 RepID=UPI0024E0461D|nr:hemerythrin domain-containing protein [Streptomyces albus]GHJ22222.1 hypothetical protein TPA0909_38360 [Streptomyces albus]